MPTLLEMIQQEKVEWKTLGEVCATIGNISWKDNGEQEFLYVDLSSVDRNTNKITEVIKITSETAPSRAQRIIKTGDIIFGTTRPMLKRLAKVSDKFNNQICSTGFYVFRATDNVLPEYIYHILSSNSFYRYVEENQKGASYPAITNVIINQYHFPLPSLEIQQKIVEVLDDYSEKVSELNYLLAEELTMRTKQYSYYRDYLLSEQYLSAITAKMNDSTSHCVVRKSLNQVATFRRGKRLVRSELQLQGTYPVYQNSLQPLGYYHEKNVDGGKSCVITAGAAGDIFYQEDDFWAADDVLVIKANEDNVLNKYVYYYLLNQQHYLKSKVRKASVPRLSREEVEQIELWLPPLTIQSKVVAILDKFQALVEESKGLLPHEIELRQKEYEYWREKLLTFEVDGAKIDKTRQDKTRQDKLS